MVARRSIGVCPCSAAARRSTRSSLVAASAGLPRAGLDRTPRDVCRGIPGHTVARVRAVSQCHAADRCDAGRKQRAKAVRDLHARHRGSGAGRSLPFATPALLHPIKLVSPVLWALNDHGRTGKPKRSGCRMPPQGYITFRRRPNPTFQFCSYKATSPFARYVNPGRATGPDRFEIPWRRPDARSGGVPCVRRPGTCANGL
jgi:hypothetical protein